MNGSAAYPVTDMALRYVEELIRVHMYQTSLREYALHRMDRDLQDLLGKRIVKDVVARLWHQTVDDVALTCELLMTVTHARRQGFLSLATPHLTVDKRRCALTMPITSQDRILMLLTAKDVANMKTILTTNTDATETMLYTSGNEQEL